MPPHQKCSSSIASRRIPSNLGSSKLQYTGEDGEDEEDDDTDGDDDSIISFVSLRASGESTRVEAPSLSFSLSLKMGGNFEKRKSSKRICVLKERAGEREKEREKERKR